MSNWFKVNVKALVIATLYLTMIYTAYGVFYQGVNMDNFRISGAVPIRQQFVVEGVEVEATPIEQGVSEGISAGILALVVSSIIVVVGTIFGGWGIPLAIAVFGVAGTTLTLGGVGFVAGYYGYKLGFSDVINYFKIATGTVVSYAQFIFGFLTFDIMALGGSDYVINLLLMFMALPVWLYFTTVLTGFIIEALKALQILMVLGIWW